MLLPVFIFFQLALLVIASVNTTTSLQRVCNKTLVPSAGQNHPSDSKTEGFNEKQPTLPPRPAFFPTKPPQVYPAISNHPYWDNNITTEASSTTLPPTESGGSVEITTSSPSTSSPAFITTVPTTSGWESNSNSWNDLNEATTTVKPVTAFSTNPPQTTQPSIPPSTHYTTFQTTKPPTTFQTTHVTTTRLTTPPPTPTPVTTPISSTSGWNADTSTTKGTTSTPATKPSTPPNCVVLSSTTTTSYPEKNEGGAPKETKALVRWLESMIEKYLRAIPELSLYQINRIKKTFVRSVYREISRNKESNLNQESKPVLDENMSRAYTSPIFKVFK